MELSFEKKTVRSMVRIYCRGKGHVRLPRGICGYCEELLQYTFERLDQCVFRETKPACSRCPVHCYRPDQRKAITAVMRYSGPKMVWKHPLLAISHIMIKKITKNN